MRGDIHLEGNVGFQSAEFASDVTTSCRKFSLLLLFVA